jgi:hypothetical protein
VQKDDIAKGSGEDRAQYEYEPLDGYRFHSLVLQVAHPLANLAGHDLVHAHGAEPGQDVLAELVRVRLARGGFHHVVRQPLFGDVPLERLPAAPRVIDPALGDLGFRTLPRLGSVLPVREGPGRP